LIRCRGVTKTYRQGTRTVEALRGLDLDIAQGEFAAIMGQSGSGKSTLLHLLSSLDRPDTGTIEIADQHIETLTESEATLFRRRQIGIVFQQFNLIPTLTALENVELPGLLAGEPLSKLRSRAEELLALLGLSDRSTHRPDALSGGEQQRVAIARAMLFSPPVLFADEPSGNLDSANASKLWGLLQKLVRDAAGAMTIVMVTHEPAAAAYAKSVHVLADGQLTHTFLTEGLDATGVAARYQECVRKA
jgi:putative ABC transport system ATP-binding protein